MHTYNTNLHILIYITYQTFLLIIKNIYFTIKFHKIFFMT